MRALLCLLILVATPLFASEVIRLQVSLDGDAPFRSIQQAINSLPDNGKQAIIHIGPGLYREKLYLSRDKVALIGAGPTLTEVNVAELRTNWLKQHPSDWGAAVVNIRASDIALLDIAIVNSYGALTGDNEHQFAIRGFEQASRIITANCRIIAGGADTLSLWNKTDGMYYHDNCYFEGHTDMVCPRGWAFFSNSVFINKKAYATLWHDGESDAKQKLVVVDSGFDGVPGFMLGRRHYDAQFYLINNQYSSNMADKAIFRHTYPAEPERDRANLWGDRYYFSSTVAPAYNWMQNSLPDKLSASDITARWAFDGRWDPEQQLQLLRQISKE